MLLIEGNLKKRLRDIVIATAPREAVGLILPPRQVVELINLEESMSNFRVSRDGILTAIAGVEREYLDEVVFWHSHPGGGIGPSTIDLQQKTRFTYHLVVSLVDGDIVSTWY